MEIRQTDVNGQGGTESSMLEKTWRYDASTHVVLKTIWALLQKFSARVSCNLQG